MIVDARKKKPKPFNLNIFYSIHGIDGDFYHFISTTPVPKVSSELQLFRSF